MTSMEYEDISSSTNIGCEGAFDTANIKAILTDFILNYTLPDSNSKVANAIVFPHIHYIVYLLNQALALPSDKHKLQMFTLTVKGGLATNEFFNNITFGLDVIDRRTIQELSSKITDYDTTITFRKGSEIPISMPEWKNRMKELFSFIEIQFNSNLDIKNLLVSLMKNLQEAICTKKFNRVNNLTKESTEYKGFPVSKIPEFEKLFPNSCNQTYFNDTKTFRRDINYSKKENLYLVFESQEEYMWRKTDNENTPLDPNLGLSFLHLDVTNKKPGVPPGTLLFTLDRILGNLALYEEMEIDRKFNPVIKSQLQLYSQNIEVPSSYNFEILDISVDEDYNSIRDESTLGTVDVYVDVKDSAGNNIKINFFNIASIIFDSYNMFSEERDKVSKPEKRCKRLFIFLRVYEIIKKYVYDKISSMFNVSPGQNTYKNVDTFLFERPEFRKLIEDKIPEYGQIKELETILSTKLRAGIFLENVKNFCYKIENRQLVELRDEIFQDLQNLWDEIFENSTEKTTFSDFITRSLKLFDTLKDGTADRIIRDSNKVIQKDIDYFARLMLYDNINTWKVVSEEMKKNYGGDLSVYNHGGVQFVDDVLKFNIPETKSLSSDILNRIQTFVKNKILISYDIDTFIIDKTENIDSAVNRVLQLGYSFSLSSRDSYNWEILNIEDIGIYKAVNYFKSPICSGKESDKCYMYFYKDNLYNAERYYLPFTVIRGNIIMKSKYCDMFYVANTIDFNIINISQAEEQILKQNPKVSFQLFISLLLYNKRITLDEYLYLTSLYFFRRSEKPYNRLIRAFFYGFKSLQGILENNYPFNNLDTKIKNIFLENPSTIFLTLEIDKMKLTSTEIVGILEISPRDILNEVVETEKLSSLYPTCINPL